MIWQGDASLLYFIDGSLGTKEAQNIVPNIKQKLISYQENKQDILYTQDTHQSDYLETQEGKRLPVEHCIENSHGWEIHPELQGFSSLVFKKNTFGSSALASYLQENTYDEIELVGVCTDICVISNALLIKAFLPETPIKVDSACCAGVTKESHENALRAMGMCQIIIT